MLNTLLFLLLCLFNGVLTGYLYGTFGVPGAIVGFIWCFYSGLNFDKWIE